MVAVVDVCGACASEEGRTEGRCVREVSEVKRGAYTLYGRFLGFLDYEEGIPSN